MIPLSHVSIFEENMLILNLPTCKRILEYQLPFFCQIYLNISKCHKTRFFRSYQPFNYPYKINKATSPQ